MVSFFTMKKSHETPERTAHDTMADIERYSVEDRWDIYQRIATSKLIRFLIEKSLVIGDLKDSDCKVVGDCKVEHADGIAFVFDVKGSKWEIQILRKDECREAILKNPERLKDPDLFKMDLNKKTGAICRNSSFYN